METQFPGFPKCISYMKSSGMNMETVPTGPYSYTSYVVKSSGIELARKQFPGVPKVLNRENTGEMPSIWEIQDSHRSNITEDNLSTYLTIPKLI